MTKYLFLFSFLMSAIGHGQVERMEPPFWWSGMEHSEVQLMFYGENIADYRVSGTEEIPVTGVRRTENPNYLFVTLETKDILPGSYELRFSADKGEGFSAEFELKPRREGSAQREGFDASDVIYLLMPDRFANGDPSNDTHPDLEEGINRGAPGGRHGGDIQGIIDHLDYIEDLGATAIWSTPLLEDNDSSYSYHTYAQSDVYRIDPRYGTNEEYRALSRELHQRDMKLIMDYVTNHWGAQHWMIKDLPTYDWIHQFPGYRNTNYRMTAQFDPHRAASDDRLNEEGWFVPSMPDLNQENPLVLNYLIQNAIWWVEYANLDGFRVDTYSYNDKEGIARWTKAIMKEYPNFNIVGEVWMHDQAQISYWQKDSPVGAIQSYNSGLPSVMDFTLHDAILQMFDEDEQDWSNGMVRAYENFANDFLYREPLNLLVFAGNHDTNRINEEFDGDLQKYKLALSLILTTRGIPQLYYGDEIGMRGDKSKGDGDIRRDFPGGWEADSQSAFSPDQRTAPQQAYHSFTKKLLNFRKDAEVLHFGKLLHYIPQDNVYVYFRLLPGQGVMVILNNSPESRELDLARYAEGLKGSKTGRDIISGTQYDLKGTLSIPGKSPLILELK